MFKISLSRNNYVKKQVLNYVKLLYNEEIISTFHSIFLNI